MRWPAAVPEHRRRALSANRAMPSPRSRRGARALVASWHRRPRAPIVRRRETGAARVAFRPPAPLVPCGDAGRAEVSPSAGGIVENDTLLTGENAAFLDAQYEPWLRSPESVDEAWRSLFETWGRPSNG